MDFKLSLDKENFGDLVYLNVSITDKNGITESNADRKLEIHVENGELLGFGSANPRTEEKYQSGTFTTYYGMAQAIIRCNGNCKASVSGEKLKAVSISL